MSQPVFNDLSLIQARIRAASHLLVGLDYDGTLAPFTDLPSQAKLCVSTREALEGLVAQENTSVAIVTGRSLQDIRTLVDIDGLIHAGNHGLEISGPEFNFLEPRAFSMRKTLGWIAAALAKGLSEIDGAIVEFKTLSISVHCRRVAPEARNLVHRQVLAAAGIAPERLGVSAGNLVFDVRPKVDWHKGSAMCWIDSQLRRQNTLILYLGDDRTDEDAFRALTSGITVKVGAPDDTCAHYFLDGPSSVAEFLVWIRNVRKKGKKASEPCVS